MNSQETHHDDDQENSNEESWWDKRKREFSDQVSGLSEIDLKSLAADWRNTIEAKATELANDAELQRHLDEWKDKTQEYLDDWTSSWDKWQEILQKKLKGYLDVSEAQAWLEENTRRVRRLFDDCRLRDFVFEPFKGVFAAPGATDDEKTRSVITQVAVVNAVLAGLPGRLGIGVYICLALEAWMAYMIARAVGIEVKKPADVWKYFGLLAATAGTILWLFRHILGFAFSLFSIIPELNPMILAELLVTDLVGILFWTGFQEAKNEGSFRIPKRLLVDIGNRTVDLFKFQLSILKNVLNPENILLVGKRLYTWLKGEIPIDDRVLRGEVFAGVAMTYLITSRGGKLQGPLGEMFIESIRARYPDLENASVVEIAEHMQNYAPEQMQGVFNMIKGEMFERLVKAHENADGDTWTAHLHEDRSYPGSDIIFTDDNGTTVEVSLKATDNANYIEEALRRYPDIPIMTTEEVKEHFGDEDMVWAGPFSHAHVKQVTKENFATMVDELKSIDTVEVAVGGAAAKCVWQLWPFVVAYFRKRISYDNLETACLRVLGEMGKELASRIPYAIIFGPVFAWYLLARVVMGLTRIATPKHTQVRYLSYNTAH